MNKINKQTKKRKKEQNKHITEATMREIPDLQVLCLRAIGSHVCSVEKTFAPITVVIKDDEHNNNNNNPDNTSILPSRASRLLRRFHDRNQTKTTSTTSTGNDNNKNNTSIESSITQIPMIRKPCIGQGSSRRVNANEVDLNHPIIACRMPLDTTDTDCDNNDKYSLVMQYGSTALDCLQSYIDSLVEIGRMDDTRLGIHFFNEWKANVILQQQNSTTTNIIDNDLIATKPNNSNKKRKRSEKQNYSDETEITNTTKLPLGSLSLHNCTIATDTFNAMIQSNMVQYLAVLDVTGVHGMNDDIAYKLFSGNNNNTTTTTTTGTSSSSVSTSTTTSNIKCCNLVRISLKNCRKISKKTIQLLTECCSNTLQCLDIGGCFNISPNDVLDVLPKLTKLTSLHSSGIQWTNELLPKLINCKLINTSSKNNKNNNNNTSIQWEGLSFGFCNAIQLTQSTVKECLLQLATSTTLVGTNLQSLSIPFCESIVDNALVSYMGRYLLQLQFLDIRGNYNVSTISSWYDGRLSSSTSTTTTTSTTNTIDSNSNNTDTSSDEQEQEEELDGNTSTGRLQKNHKKVIISSELTVLARYTNITEVSLEETRRIHPQSIKSLTIYLGGTGTGSGVTREYK